MPCANPEWQLAPLASDMDLALPAWNCWTTQPPPRASAGVIGYRAPDPTVPDAVLDDSDENLMLRYAAGEARAFELLYARFRTRLLRYLTRLTGQSAVAEELFQETWGRVIDHRQRYTPSARFAAWLFRIAHHLAIDHLRRQHPTVAADEVLLQFPGLPEDDPALRLDQDEQVRRLLTLVDALPVEQRAVLLQRAEGDLTLEEIAQNTGTGRETIKSRLRYALAKLREGLRGS
ncbi:MAG: sigma-70 family RNA polymerase sigma factor [Lysobacterales bacterium]